MTTTFVLLSAHSRGFGALDTGYVDCRCIMLINCLTDVCICVLLENFDELGAVHCLWTDRGLPHQVDGNQVGIRNGARRRS